MFSQLAGFAPNHFQHILDTVGLSQAELPAGSLESKSVTMIVQKISEKGLQIGKLSRTEKLEKRGAFLEQLLEKF